MVRNEEKYQLALEYRKRGFTYGEIAKIVGLSKSTISNWFAKKAFSKRIKKENETRASRENVKRVSLVNKARNTQRSIQYKEAIRSAETEFKHYKHSPLFIAGLMLYLGSGDMQDSSRIRLTTNNSELHRIFITFLKDFCGVENTNISFWILLYGGVPKAEAVKRWSKKIKLPTSQFGKTQSVASQKSKMKRLHYGTGNTIIGNTVLKKKLIRWIELIAQEL